MKIFAIRDEEIHPIRDLAYLFYYERQKEFYIEIPQNANPWELPMILFNYAQKKEFTLNAKWSKIWVSQRIVPPDRQNLGQILKDNGLKEYDEYKLLMLCHGRCAQDSCYIAEISTDNLPADIRERESYKIEAALPMNSGNIIVFFKDGSSNLCDIRKITSDDLRYQRLLAYYDRFRRLTILAGGHGISWDKEHTIDDLTLYNNGIHLPISIHDLRESLESSLIDAQEAADFLGCSRQYINMLVKKGSLHPIRQTAKSTIFLRSDLQML